MTDRACDLSIVIFAYNEAENIGVVLQELIHWLRENEPSSEVLIVDDGSSDGTAEAAERALRAFPHSIVVHKTNRGIGAALKSGVAAANGHWVTFLPADGQIPPDAIGELRTAAKGDTQIVLSVYDHRDDGMHRKVLSWGVRSLIWAVHGIRLQSDGPYLFQHSLFDAEQLKPDSFFLNFEFPIRAYGAGLHIETVKVECRKRLAGQSKSAGLGRIRMVATDLWDLRKRRWRHSLDRTFGRSTR